MHSSKLPLAAAAFVSSLFLSAVLLVSSSAQSNYPTDSTKQVLSTGGQSSSDRIEQSLRDAIGKKAVIVVKDISGAYWAVVTRNVELLENRTLRVPKGSRVMMVPKDKAVGGESATIAKNLLAFLSMIPANDEGSTKEFTINVDELIMME